MRHYGESLAALDWVDRAVAEGPGGLLDLGSGAGFPGLVLAAARPDLAVTLVEARERKVAFLRSAARRSGLSVTVVGGRVTRPLPRELPEAVSLLTLRAIRFPVSVLHALADRYPRARWLFWVGADAPETPPSWRLEGERALAGSSRRRVLLLEPPTR